MNSKAQQTKSLSSQEKMSLLSAAHDKSLEEHHQLHLELLGNEPLSSTLQSGLPQCVNPAAIFAPPTSYYPAYSQGNGGLTTDWTLPSGQEAVMGSPTGKDSIMDHGSQISPHSSKAGNRATPTPNTQEKPGKRRPGRPKGATDTKPRAPKGTGPKAMKKKAKEEQAEKERIDKLWQDFEADNPYFVNGGVLGQYEG